MTGVRFSLNLYSCLTTVTELANVLGTSTSQVHGGVSLCPQDDIRPQGVLLWGRVTKDKGSFSRVAKLRWRVQYFDCIVFVIFILTLVWCKWSMTAQIWISLLGLWPGFEISGLTCGLWLVLSLVVHLEELESFLSIRADSFICSHVAESNCIPIFHRLVTVQLCWSVPCFHFFKWKFRTWLSFVWPPSFFILHYFFKVIYLACR